VIDSRVVDTNVLIVASAADDGSPFRPEATPVEEAQLRQRVLDWLINFEADAGCHVVLDYDWRICGEYRNKLTDQDYGWMAIMAKNDRNEVVWIAIDVDVDGHGVVPDRVAPAITDLADRKMVTAVLAALGAGHTCKLTNACDTDWLDCANTLAELGIETEHIIEDWLRTKWNLKGRR